MTTDETAKRHSVDEEDTASRETAKTVLMGEIRLAEMDCKIAGLRQINLKALYDSLPATLNPEADEALLGLLLDARRKLQI